MSEVKLEKLVQPFYEALEQGKMMGRKCPECGAVEFPPVYACNTCGCLHTEWYEISGKAKMHSIVMPGALSSKPEYKAMGKYAYGEIESEEGTKLNGVVVGITKKNKEELVKQLPLDIHAKIIDKNDEFGLKTVVFELDEKYTK